jgi:hypothetical protein
MPEPGQWRDAGVVGNVYQWSPDGSTLYFLAQRDGFRCIWGRHLNPATKEPVGEIFPVFHAHNARLSLMGLSVPGPTIARNNAVFAQAERGGNIWIGKLNAK